MRQSSQAPLDLGKNLTAQTDIHARHLTNKYARVTAIKPAKPETPVAESTGIWEKSPYRETHCK